MQFTPAELGFAFNAEASLNSLNGGQSAGVF
jgi:hypothetical protein